MSYVRNYGDAWAYNRWCYGVPMNYTQAEVGAMRTGEMQRTLGGFTREAIFCGDYSAVALRMNASDYCGAMPFCGYAYRNQPNQFHPDSLNNTPRWPAPKPLLPNPVSRGLPTFKTTKALGLRAVVADDFYLCHDGNGNGNPNGPYIGGQAADPLHGLGIYAHRDGYNLLYGDTHAGWYGDAQQTIIWYDEQPGLIEGTFTDIGRAVNGYAGAGDTTRGHGGDKPIWNLFDQAAGIDVP